MIYMFGLVLGAFFEWPSLRSNKYILQFIMQPGH